MELFINCLIFVAALAVLVKSADYFVDSAEYLGKYMGIPSFVIGVTIVAMGTSLPELITAMISVHQKSSEIVLGNVIGSNIANVLLILGTAALFTKSMEIKWNVFARDMPMFFASGLMLCFVVWPMNPMDKYVTLGESLLLLTGYIVYTVFSLSQDDIPDKPAKKSQKSAMATSKKVKKYQENEDKNYSSSAKASKRVKKYDADAIVSSNDSKKISKKIKKTDSGGTSGAFKSTSLLIFLGSMVGIFFGAQYTIESVIKISEILKIGKEVVAISAVAIGTSLPELFVSISAVRKKKYDMAFGNVAGSNIFNTFAVVGIPGIYASIQGPGVVIAKTVNEFAMQFFVFTYVLFLVVMMDNKISRMEGIALLLCYVLFIGKLFAFM